MRVGQLHTSKAKERIRLSMLGSRNAVGPHLSVRGDKNPSKRLEVREKIRLARLGNRFGLGHTVTESQKEASRQRMLGDRNPMRNPIVLEKVRGDKHPCKRPEVRAKKSSTMSRLILEGKFHPERQGRGGYFDSAKNGKRLHYRSSYELLAYKLLEQLSEVVSFVPEPFSIPYFREDGSPHRYIPDILVTYRSGKQELVEVVAEWQLEVKESRFEAGRRWCTEHGMTFVVWTERELHQ
jgi:hypothetical protein